MKSRTGSAAVRPVNAKMLCAQWGISATHPLYHREGRWYHQLKEFPGVLLDADGFIVFQTKQDLDGTPGIRQGASGDMAVPEGISSLDGYIRVTAADRCLCCEIGTESLDGQRVCPICEKIFKGNGWDGIDAHWRSQHEDILPYERFRDTLCSYHRSGGGRRRTWSVQRKPHHIDRLDNFLREGIVAIGWPEKNFSGISRQKLDRLVRAYYEGKATPAVLTKKANSIWNFVHEMKVGDMVLVPAGKHVYAGTIESPYFHDASKASELLAYSNQRRVRWFPQPLVRSELPQSVQNTLAARFPPVLEVPEAAVEVRSRVGAGSSTKTAGRPVGLKDESAYVAIMQKVAVKFQRIHNKLINSFVRHLGIKAAVNERNYDLLVRDWKPGRFLLVEAKSRAQGGVGRQQIREAIGQLFDYRFMLEQEGIKNIDMALLLPEQPHEDILSLLYGKLGIEVVWESVDRFQGTAGVSDWLMRPTTN